MKTSHYILALSLIANGLMASVACRVPSHKHTVTNQVTTDSSTPATIQKDSPLTWPSSSPKDLDTLANSLKASGCSLQLIGDLLAPAFHQETNQQAIATMLRMRRDQLPWTPATEWEAFAGETMDFEQIEEDHAQRMRKIFGPLSGDSNDEDERFDDWPQYRHSIRDNVYAGISPTLKAKLHQLREERSQELARLRGLADRESDEVIRDQIIAMKSEQLNQLRISGSVDATEIDEYALRTSPHSRIVRDITSMDLNDDEMRTIVQSLESPNGHQIISSLLGEEAL